MARKITSITLLGFYVVVYLTFILTGLFGLGNGDELGYALLAFYIVMPFMSLACGTVWGLFVKSPVKWLFVVAAGLLQFLLAEVVFDSHELILELTPACLALLGLVVGEIIRMFVLKAKEENKVRLQA